MNCSLGNFLSLIPMPFENVPRIFRKRPGEGLGGGVKPFPTDSGARVSVSIPATSDKRWGFTAVSPKVGLTETSGKKRKFHRQALHHKSRTRDNNLLPIRPAPAL